MAWADDLARGKTWASQPGASVSFRTTLYSIAVSADALDDPDEIRKMMDAGITCAIGYEEFGTSHWIHFVSDQPIEKVEEYWKSSLYGYVLIKPIETWLGWAEKLQATLNKQ